MEFLLTIARTAPIAIKKMALLQPYFTPLSESLSFLAELGQEPVEPSTVFVPVLRGALPLSEDESTFYAKATQKYYFKAESLAKNLQIFTGETLYDEILEFRRGLTR